MSPKNREFDYTLDDFNFLRKISYDHTGIVVTDDKFDMFYSRLSRRLRILGLDSMQAYCDYLKNNQNQEFTEFINAITTNLTSFFREKHHFEYLQDTLIPEIIKKNAAHKTIKVWSAGCSTGEEPYSIAMTLYEYIPRGWTIKILATDLDTDVLAKAEEGVYAIERINGIPQTQLKAWFQIGKGENQNKVRVNSILKKDIVFKSLNLMEPLPFNKPFDFIFCRNVLIYFDRETKERLAQQFANCLGYGSRLFIGHSESLHQLQTEFELLGNTIYIKK